jgi:hypothetical protein
VATRPTRKPHQKKPAAATETSESIAEQTQAFLKSGKKIEVVQSGISGQPTLGANKQAALRGGRKS